jgi:hypothetical protein
MRTIHLLAAAAAALAAAPAAAQGTERPSVRVEAEAEAASLRSERQPRATLRLHGCDAEAAPRVEERRNLPERVAPGATYRDARIRVTIEAPLRVEAAAALREALADMLAPPACGGDPADETSHTDETEDG